MKWDDGNRKTNKTRNWSEKCYVAVRAPREAIALWAEGSLKLSLLRMINTQRAINDAVSPVHVTPITLLNEQLLAVAPAIFAYNTWDNLSLASDSIPSQG